MSSIPLSQAPADLSTPPADGRSARRLTAGGWIYLWIIAFAVIVAALSLLIPSTPSYDPWSWLVWGREILHGSLHTQGGPTWKPLPVFVDAVFAIFGRAQPDLWLIVARAGGVAAVLMAGKLAGRFTLWIVTRGEPVDRRRRFGTLAPVALAAVLGALSLAWSGSLISSTTLGYSEALAIVSLAIGLERHLDGRYRQAFAIGLVAALVRPETWVVWGPYGLWLMWRDPGARAMVISLGVLTLLLWFVPQKLGGGSLISGVTRAHHPRSNSAAYASCPICSEIFHHAWNLVLLRTKFAALLTILAGVLFTLRTVMRERAGRGLIARLGSVTADRRSFGILMLTISGLFGYGWWVLVGLETQAGFSGNDRYLVIGSAFIVLAAAGGFGWAAAAITEALGRPRSTGMLLTTNVRGIGATILAILVFLFVPNWFANKILSVSATHRSLVYQANLRSELSAFIARMGGPQGITDCGAGNIMVEGFQVPMVSWYLHRRLSEVESPPPLEFIPAGSQVPPGLVQVSPNNYLQETLAPPWPNVIMQDRDTGHAPLMPTWQTIRHWQSLGAHFRIFQTKEIRFFVDCAAQPTDPKVRPAI